MKRSTKLVLFTLLFFALTNSQVSSQNYLTLGGNFGSMLYRSDDLDRFKDTYNFVNQGTLSSFAFLQGFGSGEGVGFEIGYRHFGRWNFALLIGRQNHKGIDSAEFQNREARRLKLQINNYYVESEFGFWPHVFFVSGLVRAFFVRNLTLESKHSDPSQPNPLNGTYKSSAPFAIDLGVAIGILREPVMVTGKITYPIYTGGHSNILEDPDPAKIADGFNFFPDDFAQFFDGMPYKGIAGDIDGLKISVTIAVVLPL